MKVQRYAVIELGTRGIRLLVADASPSGIRRVIHSTGGFSDLGNNRDAEGNISLVAIERVKCQVDDYMRLAREKGANIVRVIATEAVRSAPNKKEFRSKLEPVAEISVLKKEFEATYSLVASVEAFREDLNPGDTVLVLDQGGGSTELACGTIDADGVLAVLGRQSLKLGTVVLAKQLVDADSLANGFRRVEETIHHELEKHEPFAALRERAPAAVYGLGSAITEFAQSPAIGLSHRDCHGQSIPKEKLGQFIDILRSQDSTSSVHDLGLDDGRITMIAGALTYYQILEDYHARGIRVSRHGLRYGVLLAKAGYPFRNTDEAASRASIGKSAARGKQSKKGHEK